jgi:nucleotide-binding universal stress UspA family protein
MARLRHFAQRRSVFARGQLDFSEPSFRAAPCVRTIASSFSATVSVLTVIPSAWNNPPGGMLPIAGLDAPEHELQARQDRVLAQEFAGLAACRMTDLGDPALKTMEFARGKHFDLIMMATHGVSGYRAMLLGSVTMKVLNDARCPVWTATHAEEQRSPAAPRTILCAVDDTPHTLA